MNSERDAWLSLIQLANKAGRQGLHVRNVGVCPPTSADGEYAIYLEPYHPEATEPS